MSTAEHSQEYRVLARKYRPSNFNELIGQEAMVRTLSNAIDTGRLAHAFIMTGVRGVGKTTTARIIAKGLNCLSTDGPTIEPCGTCDACTSITESRHVDVLEMDAASRTGVDDIREIIESVRYAPVSARYKIYIIDEVHMLSKNAFNALLKTLEEPPEHVKFIFATTEIRKLPVTVVSRCQRFDLKRIEAQTLVSHLASIIQKEDCEADEDALKLIARAAEGSVRDSLSLLDQAIAHTAGKISEQQVRDMLGLADRAQVIDLFEQVMKGSVGEALTTLRRQYDSGADPVVVINDLLEVTHWLTRLKVTPETGADSLTSEAEAVQGRELSEKLAMPVLTRAWQMLMKGLVETRSAPSPIAAAEMVLIRLSYAANLPAPSDLVKKVQASAQSGGSVGLRSTGGSAGSSASAGPQANSSSMQSPTAQLRSADVVAMKPQTTDAGEYAKHPMPVSFEKLIDLFHQEKESALGVALSDLVSLVHFSPGKLEINPTPKAPVDLIMRVKRCLQLWTGQDWLVTVSKAEGQISVRQKEINIDQARKAAAMKEPIVKELLIHFPEAELLAVREKKMDEVLSGDPEAMLLEMQDFTEGADGDNELADFDFE
ncbi:DNA polymerase III subunit gamma/tau [Temperatibacter marinus]|uniref:DNA polymerase III subunit gamma/tau n=1 Tax=Temperatibacter marinus TaxID=1456591 RepID=A0AA52HB36_9PROT|nr:DNA polymerase III subunit gamma/tau [Temperatibacter marinus]WND03365.1 DNA polymerase III subunit gamma/tau [Temperatibacter marinus]